MATIAAPPSPPDGEPGDPLRSRAAHLGLHGLVARWAEHGQAPWVEKLLELEEAERSCRSLERRIKAAQIGRFKLLADFDWAWPKRIDREQVEELFTFDFMKADCPMNVALLGPNGTGKTTICQNLAHQAVLRGYSVRFITASELLNDLASQESQSSLARRLQRVCRPQLLAVDEVGYLSYDSRHADLLFEVINRRSRLERSTVITTNKPFSEWGTVFPNASSVVALVDRLVHRAEMITIEGDSYRLKEAKDRDALRATERAEKKAKKRGKR
jgi:DNA replication protein DnaC